MLERQVRGMVIMGENPAMSDPDVNHARQALASLDMLVVQDIFLTETACLADVVLPASAFAEKTGSFTNTDRAVQLGRAALALPGQARQDLWILTALAQQLGLDWSAYGARPQDCADAAAAVFDEMRRLMPSIAGITWQRLQREGSVTYPCHHDGDPGQRRGLHGKLSDAERARPVRVVGRHPGRGAARRRLPAGADHRPPARALAHRQHDPALGRARRARARRRGAAAPAGAGAPGRGGRRAHHVELASRSRSSLYARADDGMPPGAVFVAFCWAEAAINKLTNPALDPVARIPGFKYCAVRAAPARDAEGLSAGA